MPNIKDLGRAFKLEHPEYSDLSDEEAGRMVKNARPWEYRDIEDDGMDVDNYSVADRSTWNLGRVDGMNRISREFEELGASLTLGDSPGNLLQLQQYYSPGMGWFKSWWEAIKSNARKSFLDRLNPEIRAVIEQGAMMEDAVLSSRRKLAEYQSFIAHNQFLLIELRSRAYQLAGAAQVGMSPDRFSDINYETAQTNNRLREMREQVQVRAWMEKFLFDLKIKEWNEKQRLELDARLQVIQQDSDAADHAEMGDFLVAQKLREGLAQARRGRYETEKGDDPDVLKQQLLTDWDNFIALIEAKLYSATHP
jgi:hypothetical protein